MSDIRPHWPCPENIKALTTTRLNGYSQGPFREQNLAYHVHDESDQVLANRKALHSRLELPAEPEWLNQTHTNICVHVDKNSSRDADAAVTQSKSKVLAILTADCVPILLTHKNGTEIAAIHAGWRGLANGVIENTINLLNGPASAYIAWIGPSICRACYAIGSEVKSAFEVYAQENPQIFLHKGEKTFADLPGISQLILKNQGIFAVYLSSMCTFEHESLLYSYRRAPETGRMASLIWFAS